MAHLEITFELRNAIHHAIKTNKTVVKTGIEMNREKKQDTIQIINIEVKIRILFSGPNGKLIDITKIKLKSL